MTTAVKQLNQHSESPSYGQAEADVKRLEPLSCEGWLISQIPNHLIARCLQGAHLISLADFPSQVCSKDAGDLLVNELCINM